MTTTLTPPNGFTPRTLTSWNRYFIPQSDTNAYRVGDAVHSAGGTDAAGILAVTLHPGTGPARGVIVSVDPGLPATGGLSNGLKLSVPSVKLAGYYVWVDDDPSHQFAMVDDGLTPANSVAASAGKYANFTPGAAAAPNGGSVSAITSSTLGSTSGCLQVISLVPGSLYGAAATWIVKFAAHELANGGGSQTVASGAIARSTAQLAGTPSSADVGLGAGGQFYDPLQTVDATHPWVYYSASSTAYVRIAGTGGGTPSTTAPNALGTAAIGTSGAFMRADAVLPLPTARAVGAMPIASGTFDPNTGHAFDVHGTDLGVLTAGTAPPADAQYFIINAPTAVASTLSPNFTQLVNGDEVYFDSVNYQKVGVNSIGRATTAMQKGDGNSGSGGSSLVDASPMTDFVPAPLMQVTIPVGELPDLVVGANGAFIIGSQTGGGSLTFSQATAGAGVAVTESGGTAPFAATDVGRAITTPAGVACSITAFVSTTQVTVTIPTGGISSVTQPVWYLGTPVANISGGAYVNLFAEFAQGGINTTAAGPGYAAGWYYVVMSSGTVGTAFNNTYTPGTNLPAVPTTPTAFTGITGGASTTGTGARLSHSLPIAGNYLGTQGQVSNVLLHRNSNSSGTKTISQTFGGQALGYALAETTNAMNYDGAIFMNQGVKNRQLPFYVALGQHGNLKQTDIKNVDTSVTQNMQTFVTRTDTRDWAIIEMLLTTALPRA